MRQIVSIQKKVKIFFLTNYDQIGGKIGGFEQK